MSKKTDILIASSNLHYLFFIPEELRSSYVQGTLPEEQSQKIYEKARILARCDLAFQLRFANEVGANGIESSMGRFYDPEKVDILNTIHVQGQLGLRMTAHLPYTIGPGLHLGDPSEDIRAKDIEGLKSYINQVHALGVRLAVMHPGMLKQEYMDQPEQVRDQTVKSIRELVKYAARMDVILGLENPTHKENMCFCDPKAYVELILRINHGSEHKIEAVPDPEHYLTLATVDPFFTDFGCINLFDAINYEGLRVNHMHLSDCKIIGDKFVQHSPLYEQSGLSDTDKLFGIMSNYGFRSSSVVSELIVERSRLPEVKDIMRREIEFLTNNLYKI